MHNYMTCQNDCRSSSPPPPPPSSSSSSSSSSAAAAAAAAASFHKQLLAVDVEVVAEVVSKQVAALRPVNQYGYIRAKQ